MANQYFPDKIRGVVVPDDDKVQLGTTLKPINSVIASTATITTLTATTQGATTFSGAVTASGGVINPVGATTGTITKPGVFIGAVDAAYVLPLAASFPGSLITIITGTASAGTGLTIAPGGTDKIQAMTKASGGTALTDKTTVTNTGATDVVGDCMVLQSDGVSNWRAVSIIGTWA